MNDPTLSDLAAVITRHRIDVRAYSAQGQVRFVVRGPLGRATSADALADLTALARPAGITVVCGRTPVDGVAVGGAP